jgi:Zn-dependent peptidase ImmA (M78 family)
MSNKSNTVAKGNAFENRVFRKFKEWLETGELPISIHSRIYQKKSYKGKSGSDIVFDISIESYMPNTKELIDFIENQNHSLNFDSELLEQLGCCDFQNKRILVTNLLEYNSPRWRFTLAHEVGHVVLHHYIFKDHNIMLINDDDGTINVSEGVTKRLEIQANMFAANLLVPDKICFEQYVLLHKRLVLRNFPFLYVDNQFVNQNSYHVIAGELAEKFGVSKEVIRNKLLEMHLLNICRTSRIFDYIEPSRAPTKNGTFYKIYYKEEN